MVYNNIECLDLGPIILFLIIIEAILFQITFLILRIVFCGSKKLYCIGLFEIFMTVIIIGYFQIIPNCKILLS